MSPATIIPRRLDSSVKTGVNSTGAHARHWFSLRISLETISEQSMFSSLEFEYPT